MTIRPIFWKSLVIYAVISGVLSVCQADYVGADFVAYVTVARRVISQPAHAITGYWSPLFSWLMIPFLAIGVDDLIAGRLVLLISGAIYLWAIDCLTVSICPGNSGTNRLIQIGVMTCSTIQASTWTTYLLDPDLVANAVLYLYFCLVLPRDALRRQPTVSFLTGVIAGVAYLAKAYMLPFCLLHFVLTLVCAAQRRRSERFVVEENQGIGDSAGATASPSSASSAERYGRADYEATASPQTPKQWHNNGAPTDSIASWRVMSLFVLGLGSVAGPWITCLSLKYGRPTFSTAGSANHANVSPENFLKDPLWNPGLTPDFIFEPSLTPDWSPFQDAASFLYQVRLIFHNAGNCIGLIPLWLAAFLVGFWAMKSRRIQLNLTERFYLVWSTMTVLVYCAGYTTVNLEARYVVPTVVPLLCLASLIMLRSVLVARMTDTQNQPLPGGTSRSGDESTTVSTQIGWLTGPWAVAVVILVVSLIGAVDIHGLVRIATVHPQSIKREKFRIVAEQLRAAQLPDVATACSDWHLGLYIAYVENRLPNYWGAPLARVDQQISDELDSKDVKVYFRFVPEPEGPAATHAEFPPFGEPLVWTKSLVVHHRELSPWAVEVYVRR